MEARPLIVLDCNILLSAALLTGPPFSLPALNRVCMRRFADTDSEGRSALALMAALSTVGMIRYCTSDHILDTVEFKLTTMGEWDDEDAVGFSDRILADLINASGGLFIDHVTAGWMRMGDHEDSCVYETCRRAVVEGSGPVILVTDDRDLAERVRVVCNTRKPPWDDITALSPDAFVRHITLLSR